MGQNSENTIIGYCIYCKNEIEKGKKYIVNEDGNKLHKECDRLIEDNADYFGR